MLIHHNQAVHARLANRIEDGVQTICQRACVDTREVLETARVSLDHRNKSKEARHTGERFFNASPTVKLKSS